MDDAPVELSIESIAAGGDGVARSDGLVVFVPRAAPGDVIESRIEQRGRLARGRADRIVHPSSTRREPPCPHYTRDRCGGCQLQHMTYAAQLEAKQAIVRDSIVRIARRAAELPEVRASPTEWRYRRKLTLALRWRRDRWIAGLHPYDDPAAVFVLDDCPITEEPVVAVWKSVLLASAHLPRVPALRGAVRLAGSGAAFVLEGADAWPGARRFFEAVPELLALWWQPEGHRRRLIAERGEREAGRDSASFVQVNEPVSSALRHHVVTLTRDHLAHVSAAGSAGGSSLAGSAARQHVVDAYAGSGETASLIADGDVVVTAIEIDRDAAARARTRLASPSRVLRGAVEDILRDALPADVVLLNPPRGGVDARVTAALEEAPVKPRAVIYVSCNPATLARDLARMPAYRIASLLGFDMFPQTAHVETVCELVPEVDAA